MIWLRFRSWLSNFPTVHQSSVSRTISEKAKPGAKSRFFNTSLREHNMHKTLQHLTKPQSFSDFAGRLAAKWRLQTRPAPGVDTHGKSTEDVLRDLVAMPTVTGNREACHDALGYIGHFLAERGMHVKRFEWNGTESLVATTQPTKAPTLYFMGHIDVVPGPQSLFQLEADDEAYRGRGVLDMKGAIAAYLGAVDELRGSLGAYDFGVMIVSDEEVGGFDGAARLAEEGFVPKVIVVPDGGNNWNIERTAKGLWHITIEATGKSAHGSRPWEGENAIDKLSAVLQEIKALFPADPSLETNTVNVGIIKGGHAINQIPATASASLDLRFVSPQGQTDIIAKVRDILMRHGLTLAEEAQSQAIANDPANPYLAMYAACTERAIGHPVEWVASSGLSDVRWFAAKGTVPAVAYPRGGGHHGLDEWIGKETLYQMQSIFVDYIQHVAAKDDKERES